VKSLISIAILLGLISNSVAKPPSEDSTTNFNPNTSINWDASSDPEHIYDPNFLYNPKEGYDPKCGYDKFCPEDESGVEKGEKDK
jgi:hypothetical protein